MKLKVFESKLFEDSFLLGMDFSHWQEEVSFDFHCPMAKRLAKKDRNYRLTIYRVLAFGFEASLLGEFGSEPLFVNGVFHVTDSPQYLAWKKRIRELSKPAPGYPKGIKSRDFSNLYAFEIDSIQLRSFATVTGSAGMQIICRDFKVARIAIAPKRILKLDPLNIPAGRGRQVSGTAKNERDS